MSNHSHFICRSFIASNLSSQLQSEEKAGIIDLNHVKQPSDQDEEERKVQSQPPLDSSIQLEQELSRSPRINYKRYSVSIAPNLLYQNLISCRSKRTGVAAFTKAELAKADETAASRVTVVETCESIRNALKPAKTHQ